MGEIDQPWTCTSCDLPIKDEVGYIHIHNANAELGPVGSHPVKATPDDWSDPQPRSGGIERADMRDLIEEIKRGHNIGYSAYHKRCITNPDASPYAFPVSGAATLGQWCVWVLHLREKTWMGRDDLMRMLVFYFSNRNLNYNAPGAEPR